MSGLVSRSFSPWVVSHIVFIEGQTDSSAGYLNRHHTAGTAPLGCMGPLNGGGPGDQRVLKDCRAPLRTEGRWHVNSVHIRLQLLCSPVCTVNVIILK